MTSKQRAYLKGLAINLEPLFHIGKSSVTPENIEAISEVFNTHELVKIAVLKNCIDDPKEIATVVAERTRSQVVQVIGKSLSSINRLNRIQRLYYRNKIGGVLWKVKSALVLWEVLLILFIMGICA